METHRDYDARSALADATTSKAHTASAAVSSPPPAWTIAAVGVGLGTLTAASAFGPSVLKYVVMVAAALLVGAAIVLDRRSMQRSGVRHGSLSDVRRRPLLAGVLIAAYAMGLVAMVGVDLAGWNDAVLVPVGIAQAVIVVVLTVLLVRSVRPDA